MEPVLTAEFFAGNRKHLRKLFTGTAPIVMSAHGLLQQTADSTLPFHQESNFWYLTGIDEPDILLVMDKDKEYLILPERDESIELFDGRISPETLQARSGISAIYDQKTGWQMLSARLHKVRHVATIAAPPAYIDHYGFYTNPSRARLIQQLKDSNSDLELLDIKDHLTRLRMVKQPPELLALKRAIAVTAQTFKKTMRRRQSYAFEYEIEADFSREFRRHGMRHGYQPIVAGGVNAGTIHHIDNDAPISKRDLLLIDIGAECEHYTADITRTYALQEPTKLQQSVFDTVLEVQNFAFSLLKPGVIMKEYEDLVCAYMGEKLRELGLIKSISTDEIRKYFPYLTSHFLGLDAHDTADYKRPLEQGMVLTVEPGIHIPEKNIGIRIEDDVLITRSGIKILTAALPRILW